MVLQVNRRAVGEVVTQGALKSHFLGPPPSDPAVLSIDDERERVFSILGNYYYQYSSVKESSMAVCCRGSREAVQTFVHLTFLSNVATVADCPPGGVEYALSRPSGNNQPVLSETTKTLLTAELNNLIPCVSFPSVFVFRYRQAPSFPTIARPTWPVGAGEGV